MRGIGQLAEDKEQAAVLLVHLVYDFFFMIPICLLFAGNMGLFTS